jgi:GNAT superfamily N-acetyltransferase
MGAERGRPGGAEGAPLVRDADDVDVVRALFREYADTLGVDLGFQGFEEEVAALPAGYDALLVAGDGLGCVGVRRFGDDDCEMKRLYVRPDGRGTGAGRALAEAAIGRARALGYARMLLDTMPFMTAAQDLYRSLGFVEIEPYRHNPVAGATFMELRL